LSGWVSNSFIIVILVHKDVHYMALLDAHLFSCNRSLYLSLFFSCQVSWIYFHLLQQFHRVFHQRGHWGINCEASSSVIISSFRPCLPGIAVINLPEIIPRITRSEVCWSPPLWLPSWSTVTRGRSSVTRSRSRLSIPTCLAVGGGYRGK